MKESTLKILHLDDDALYLEQFAATLARAPLDVPVAIESVDNEEEFFAALARATPDIAVLDVNVGGRMTGQDFVKRTKVASPGTLVFMCSDLRGVGLVSDCLAAGADDFIFKGSDERELALRLYGTWKIRATSAPEVSGKASARAPGSPGAVGKTMKTVAMRLSRIADSAVSAVHVRGESGTGKEMVSELLAAHLPKGTPFIKVNCGAIAPSLLESELFGHVRGAFTGATSDKIGLIEQADGGWIFFDEVATLSGAAQVALLRVLENHVVRKVGGTQERRVRIKVLSATNEKIETLIAAGKFRQDLWQRLCEASLELPPLRERMDEFAELIGFFAKQMSGGPYAVSDSALEILASYHWREGNVRELRNCLRAMTELAVGRLLTPLSIPKWLWDKLEISPDERLDERAALHAKAGSDKPSVLAREIRLSWDGELPTFERLTGNLLLAVLRREAAVHGKVSVRHVARVTGIPKSTLAVKLRQLVEQDLVHRDDLARIVNVSR